MTAPKPTRPKNLPQGRWLGDFPKLSAAEKALVAACARGGFWEPKGWDGKRPEVANTANKIRAELIRYLALGGDADHPIHEKGLMAKGAWIAGSIDLEKIRSDVRILLFSCFLEGKIQATDANIFCLYLNNSLVGGINANGLNAESVFLNSGFVSKGKIQFRAASIYGTFNCSGGEFQQKVDFDRISIKGSLLLTGRNGKNFSAFCGVSLTGAEIGCNLECSGGRFEKVSGFALDADSITVSGGLFLRYAEVQGRIALTGAQVGSLIDGDTLACWQGGPHLLDGFRYRQIMGFTEAAKRIAWLKLQFSDQLGNEIVVPSQFFDEEATIVPPNFKPQPWEQLIKVLREMGHTHDAAEVAIAKQEQMRVAGVIKGPVRRSLHWLYGKLAGYGHRPMRTVGAMGAVWLLFSLAFDAGREYGYFGPSNPLIHASPAFAKCGGPGETLANGAPKPFWHTPACPTPPEYTTMQPQLYSLDLILPLVDLQQDRDWSPIVINGKGDQLWGGYVLRILMWFEILFGWAMSLMLVAVLGRLVDKD